MTAAADLGPIDAYVAGFSGAARAALEALRDLLREAVPDATETIAYGIPTLDLDGVHVLHFAGYARHVGLYPTPSGMAAFDAELAPYARGKGSVRFPLDAPLPVDLIRRIAAHRVAEVAIAPKGRSTRGGRRPPPAPALTTHPLTPERWPDLEAVFGAEGCSMARGCWCMYYRETGTVAPPAGMTGSQDRRQRFRALVDGEPSPGLIGYRDGVPVGWVALAPRADYPRLRRSPVAKAVDDVPVWSVVCFVVPPAHRHQGVATGLLRGAIAFARAHGAPALEAYPLDKATPGADAWLWPGAMSMYRKAGFVEVARRRPERPVVRLVFDDACA